MTIQTTLNAIRAASLCQGGYRKLLTYLGKDFDPTAPLPVLTVLDSNGLEDALWVLINACGKSGEKLVHIFACDCAEHVLRIYEEYAPGDDRLRKALEAKRRWIAGLATDDKLYAAWVAVRDVAEDAWAVWAIRAVWAATAAATDDVAPAVATAAVWYARDAACDARDSEQQWQETRLKELLIQGEITP